jgi:hypothetical protein
VASHPAVCTRRRFLCAAAATLAAAAPLSAFKSKITKASISAVTDQIGKTQADAIDFAHHYDLSWVELRNLPETGHEFALMTEPELKRAAAELLSNKLKVSFLNTTLLKFDWDADQKRWDRRKDDLSNALLAANIFGTDKIGIFTGARETAHARIAQTLEEFIPLAEQAKVHLVIASDPSQNIGSAAAATDLLALLPSKTIGLDWDASAFPGAWSGLPKGRLMNIHFHASGILDMHWKTILETLQKDNYEFKIGLDTQGDPAKRIENANDAIDEMMHIAGRLD